MDRILWLIATVVLIIAAYQARGRRRARPDHPPRYRAPMIVKRCRAARNGRYVGAHALS